MNTAQMRSMLDQNTAFRPYLFPRGFLFTNDAGVDAQVYPFYGLWNSTRLGQYRFLVHPKQRFCYAEGEGITMALVGHAYDPVSEDGAWEEAALLQKAVSLYSGDKQAFTRYFNGWTGLFALFILEENSFRIYGDAAGMYTLYYGSHNGKCYCASHTNLLGDVCQLTQDPYIQKLVSYRFYHLFGISLPGDLSPYADFKRLIPNHFAEFTGSWKPVRFFPTEEDALLDTPYDSLIDQAAGILQRSMGMLHRKWERPAISMTGGCDSKTTLACTNGNYAHYSYFSYTSSDSESVDARAAGEICRMLGLEHRVYTISDRDEDYPDVEKIRSLMEYNTGSVGGHNRNDVRKRAFFLQVDDFDVEVKSWVSEVGRAYYHKRFAKKRFPKKLTARYATTLYKVFVTNRKLVKQTDRIFEAYLEKYCSAGVFDQIPWYDLLFWEFRMSSWNGTVITGEQHISYDITIPYNNRRLLQCLLSTPVEKRAADVPHRDIMAKMNPQIAQCGIAVVNVKHTDNRAKMERLYLEVASRLPF